MKWYKAIVKYNNSATFSVDWMFIEWSNIYNVFSSRVFSAFESIEYRNWYDMKYRLQTNIVIYQIIAQMIERREKCLKLDYKQLHELHAKWSEKNVFDSKTAYNFRLFAIILNSIWIHELLRFELDSFFTMNLSTKRKSYTHFWNTSGHYRYTFNGRFILEKLFLLLNATHCISPNPFHRANSELSILRVNHFPSVTHEIQRRSTDSAPRTFIHATQRVSDVLPPHGNASQRTWTLRSYDVSTKPSQYNQTTRAAHTAFPCVVR